MSPEHKEAIRQGRIESSAVKAYLEALTAGTATHRSADPGAIQRRLRGVEDRLAKESNPLKRLELTQQQMNLTAALNASSAGSDEAKLREGFVRFAAAYGKRRGISYKAWRAVGVPASVLKQAGISRGD
ncbi:MAG: hypothetical protein DCC49_01060 [Acidobacteria bacterium]|nr:MAG: hypothetical protein DCC49_01060 [Acidobacteriota bacterium]